MRAAIASPDLAQHERAADYLEYVRAMLVTRGDGQIAKEILRSRRPKVADLIERAAISEGRTDTTTWGSTLAELRPAGSAFVALTRARSVLGRLSGFRRVPFRVRVPRQLSGASVSWTDEGEPTALSAPSLDEITFEDSKVSGIVVISQELAKFSDPAAQTLIDNDLIAGTAEFVDRQFLDPEIAAVGDAPASITNGAASVPQTGKTEDALKADLRSLVDALEDGGSNLENAVLVMTKRQAVSIASMPIGEKLGVNGGELCGLPVVTTTSSALVDANSPTDDRRIVLLDTSLIMLADGGVEISASRQATLQMSDGPDSPSTANTVMVNMFQRNLVAAKIVRFIRWQRARDGAAAYIAGGGYAG